MPFSATGITPSLRGHQEQVIAWLTRNKFAQVIYNPFLAESFAVLFRAQKEEFTRLYGRKPDFYNGHHHMHLCANVLAGRLIPNGARVRTTFTFDQGERNPFNRLYRRYINGIVSRRYISTDRFYSIVPVRNRERLRMILSNASTADVEVEVHPENAEEIEFLMSDEYGHLMGDTSRGTFQQLQSRQVMHS
jgi:chitin disaccharide deacetylase